MSEIDAEPGGSDQRGLHVSVNADPSAVWEVRSRVREYLRARGLDGPAAFGVLVVVSELTANAIEHGSRSGDSVEVDCRIRDRSLQLVVRDRARGGVPVALSSDARRVRGRGLHIVERLASDWSERIVNGRREVQADIDLA